MKLPQLIQDDPIKIKKLVPGGQGIGTNKEGIKGFFWNALPGETITEYEITKKKSHYFEAIATKIDHPSEHRITPKDSCYLSTSPWQIMDYAYELKQKSELLSEIFRQHEIDYSQDFECRPGGKIWELRGLPNNKEISPREITNTRGPELRRAATKVRPSVVISKGEIISRSEDSLAPNLIATDENDFFYRNKMEYSLYFDHETEKLHLGFHQRGTHRKIKVETSSIERPEIFEKAQEIVAELNNNHADGRNYQSLLLRCNQKGKVAGGLYENRKPHPIFQNLTDTILGTNYSYSPNGFFQINLPVYEMALKEIKQHIKTEDVLDLYAGVGTIGLSVASDKNLTLVEVDKFAYSELERNCIARQVGDPSRAILGWPENRVPPEKCFSKGKNFLGVNFRDRTPKYPLDEPTCRPMLAKAEEVTDFIHPDQTIIVDPPRAGLDKKLVERLLEIMPETIIYLSCNPVTQARDIKILLEKYQIKSIKPFNFFPRTPHLENLIILNRK